MNGNKENEGTAGDHIMSNVVSTRKNSLLQTINMQQQQLLLDPKAKRLKAFK
jgi:hypothetical protein